jgi:phosphoribosylformylglycinamidine (FGAM) synthase PurS component
MKFQAEIDVMPKKEILDPQGKAVTEEAAKAKTDEACKNLLANLIMESYTFKVVPA